MAIIKINKTKDYTVMSNYHLKEKEMSLKAKGLLSQMLSLPEKWDYSIAGLVAINKENETSIKNTLKELQDFKYLKVTKLLPDKTKTGRIEYIYDIYEQPYEKQEVENLGVEFLGVENQGQLNTNNKNTKKLNTNNKSFIKPTLEEIQNYCLERKNGVNAQRFYDYYEANNWKDSKGNKVKSWKQKMIANWENKDYSKKERKKWWEDE